MALFVLVSDVVAVQAAPGTSQSAPPGGNLPAGSNAAYISGAGGFLSARVLSAQQTFQLIVTDTSGNCNATAQIVASNDGINWVNYGSPIVASSSTSPNVSWAYGTAAFRWYSAYITAISGTSASANVLMNG